MLTSDAVSPITRHTSPFLTTTVVDLSLTPDATPHPGIRAKMLRYKVSYPLPFMQTHLTP